MRVRLVLGEGGHDPRHAGVLLPDALRWVFRRTDDGLSTVEAAAERPGARMPR